MLLFFLFCLCVIVQTHRSAVLRRRLLQSDYNFSVVRRKYLQSRLYHKASASFTYDLRDPTTSVLGGGRGGGEGDSNGIKSFILFVIGFCPFSLSLLLSWFFFHTISHARSVDPNHFVLPPSFSVVFLLLSQITNRSRRSIWSTGHLATGNVFCRHSEFMNFWLF